MNLDFASQLFSCTKRIIVGNATLHLGRKNSSITFMQYILYLIYQKLILKHLKLIFIETECYYSLL